MLVMTKLDSN